jgi:type IV pilus assembly protein PilE
MSGFTDTTVRRRSDPQSGRQVDQQPGFTLIEMMVVVLLLSIIMALSIPGYRQYVQRANRTDATSDLLRLAASQERFYLQNGTYATNAQLAAAPPAGLGFAGSKTKRGYYNVAITVANATRFTATATADGGEKQKDDHKCETFRINESGLREAADDGGSYTAVTAEECWR